MSVPLATRQFSREVSCRFSQSSRRISCLIPVMSRVLKRLLGNGAMQQSVAVCSNTVSRLDALLLAPPDAHVHCMYQIGSKEMRAWRRHL